MSRHCKSQSHRRRPFKIGELVEPVAGGDWVTSKIKKFMAKDYVQLENGKIMCVDEIKRVLR